MEMEISLCQFGWITLRKNDWVALGNRKCVLRKQRKTFNVHYYSEIKDLHSFTGVEGVVAEEYKHINLNKFLKDIQEKTHCS